MKQITLLVGIFVLSISPSGFAQGRFSATIAGGPHDLSNGSGVRNNDTTSINGQTCVFCHVPHGGDTTQPLWNRAAPSSTYLMYTSSTMKATTSSPTIQGSISGACLSCHDGSIAMDVLTNVNGAAFGTTPKGGSLTFSAQPGNKASYVNGTTGVGNVMNGGLAFLGTDLQNDHPVSIVYNAAKSADGGHYADIAGAGSRWYISGSAGPLPLFGSSSGTATVECASCHDAHNNSLNGSNGGFLRQANTGSQMCKTCHIK